MSKITKAAGFGSLPGISMDGSEARSRSRRYWGDIEDGEPIYNLPGIQKAQQDLAIEIIDSNPRAAIILPLVDVVDPIWVRKAIFDDSYGIPGLRADIKKAQMDFAAEIESNLSTAKLAKATSTTSVSNLMHNYSDEQVVMLFKKIYPLQALIPVEANHGKVAQWDAITETGAGSASFGSEDPNPVESDITDAIRTATCKILYAWTRVTKMAKIAGQTQYPARDLMQIRNLAANEMIRNLRERALIGVQRDVTNSSSTYTAASGLEYAGLYELITNNTGATCQQTYAGGAATLDKIKPYLDTVVLEMNQHGRTPNLIVADWKTFGVIGRGMNDFYRTEQIKETEFGFSKINYVTPIGLIPIVPITFMPTTTGSYGSLMVLETGTIVRRVLWGDTFEELGNLNTSQRGVISAAEVLIDKTDATATGSLQGLVSGITIP
jgi:hypothetical protein